MCVIYGGQKSLFVLGSVKSNASRENYSMCFSLPVNVFPGLGGSRETWESEREVEVSDKQMTEMIFARLT